jgi:hypothetical protein
MALIGGLLFRPKVCAVRLLGIDFQALEAAWKQLGGSFDGSSSKFQL